MVLPALVALALSSSATAPKEPLAGCDATPVEHGWQYDCEDLRARLEDRPEEPAKVAKYVAGMHGAMAAVVGDGAVARTERRKLGGVEVEVRITQARGEPQAAFVAGLPRKAGTRVLACIGQNRRCGTVLGSLAEVAWSGGNAPGSIRKEAPPLAIAGRAVQVPEGCKSTTQPRGGRVECGKAAWVGWASMDEGQSRRMRDDYGASIRANFSKPKPGVKVSEDEVPCRLAGADTSCARFLLEAQGQRAVMLWAAAPAGEGFVFATCMAPGAGIPVIPAPCSLVFATP